jgi:predicted DNA-binding protein (MmcQ/YjbR family)
MARAKWVAFDDLAALDDAEVTDWLATAHALVAAKLTRKARQELGIEV